GTHATVTDRDVRLRLPRCSGALVTTRLAIWLDFVSGARSLIDRGDRAPTCRKRRSSRYFRREIRRSCSGRTLLRRFSMTKRNAHALQRRYTKLLARATALTPAVRHLGQGVTARPPWSLGLGMLRRHRFPHGTCQLSHDDSRQVVGL